MILIAIVVTAAPGLEDMLAINRVGPEVQLEDG